MPTPDPTEDPFAALPPKERAEIDAASAIQPEDVDDALRQWRTDASPPLRDLLDAPPDDLKP